MIEIFRSGKSPHPVTGNRVFGVPEDVIVRESKIVGLNNDPDEIAALRKQYFPELARHGFLPRTMSIRQAAKKMGHSLNYRLGYKTFALKNEIAETEAKRFVSLYREKAYPGLLKWYEQIDRTIRDTRTLTNCFGRCVYFQGALDDETFREATAFIPQSSVFDITGRAMPLMLEDETPDFATAELLAQVHDSLLTQYLSRDFRAMARYAIRLALDYMSPTLHYNDMDFVLSVGLKAGHNWGHTHEIKLTRDADALALELERIYAML